MRVRVFFVVDRAEEQVSWAAPEAMVTIKRAIDDHLLSCLGVSREIFHDVEVTFEMLIDAVNDDLILCHDPIIAYRLGVWWVLVEICNFVLIL